MRSVINWGMIVGCAALLCGCAARPSAFSPGVGNKYAYTYKMSYPVESKDMLFQGDSLLIQFKFDEAAIRFQMQNLSYSDMRIEWDKASISINGEYFSVRHSDNLYSDTAATATVSAFIPPLGYVRDIAIPRKNVAFDGQRWTERDLLPTMDEKSPALQERILKSVGKSVTLLLPVQIGSEKKNYEFEFLVSSVKKIPWQDYAPVKRMPQPPDPPKQHTLEGTTAAIIAVGLLGFTAYVLTISKSPASE
jgi:hypothetical protein